MPEDPTRPASAPVLQGQTRRDRPAPLASLVASAKRLTAQTMARAGNRAVGWQEDAWELYDLVGEQRFLATTLAGRLSQARLFVGRADPDDPTGAPAPLEDQPEITDVLDAVGDSAASLAQLLYRLGINLFVTGDGWLAGIPRYLLPESLRSDRDETMPPPPPPSDENGQPLLAIEDLEWRMLSVSEVSSNSGGQVTLLLGESDGEKIQCRPDDVWLIRVWRPHPRKWWEADSPTRSSLPVLRELVGLTMHVSAQIDSRLAGAGLLLIPQSAQRALRIAAGLPEDDSTDQFTEALMEAMLKPIQDRGNASAFVPLVATVPDEATQLFNFITFSKPLDQEARALRDEAIRRLALGQDAPPELLLGTGGMNHWGAWLVQEDVVVTHLEPPLALICDALTTQYLWPVLQQQGMDLEQAREYVIWYDVSDLIVRPNRSQDAIALYDRRVISDSAARAATGFDESDAPSEAATLPVEVSLAFDLAKGAPSLAQDPGIPVLVEQIRQVLNATPSAPSPGTEVTPTGVPPGETAPGGETVPTGTPDTAQDPATPTPIEIAASGPFVIDGRQVKRLVRTTTANGASLT